MKMVMRVHKISGYKSLEIKSVLRLKYIHSNINQTS